MQRNTDMLMFLGLWYPRWHLDDMLMFAGPVKNKLWITKQKSFIIVIITIVSDTIHPHMLKLCIEISMQQYQSIAWGDAHKFLKCIFKKFALTESGKCHHLQHKFLVSIRNDSNISATMRSSPRSPFFAPVSSAPLVIWPVYAVQRQVFAPSTWFSS